MKRSTKKQCLQCGITSDIEAHIHQRMNVSNDTFVVGDIHGDVLIFLEVAKLTGVLWTPSNPSLLDKLIDIHRSFDITYMEKYKEELGSTLGLEHLEWKKDNKSTLIFLGDIVDNYRYGGMLDKQGKVYTPYQHKGINIPISRSSTNGLNFANMAMNGEKIIVDALCRLQAEATEQHGKLVWVMGNHDISNVFNSISCSAYSSLDQCDPTNTHRYKKERVDWMREALIQTQAVVLFECNGVLLCHGGLEKKFMTALTLYQNGELVNENDKLCIPKINTFYQKAIQDPQGDEYTWLYPYIQKGLDFTWQRPLKQTTLHTWDKTLLTYFDVPLTSMIVAHTYVALPFTRNDNKELRLGQQVVNVEKRDINEIYVSELKNIEHFMVYGVDFAMSRAFNTNTSYKDEKFCTIGIMKIIGHKQQCIARLHTRCVDPLQIKSKME